MIRIAVNSSHLQKDKTYAACVVFDSMTSKEYKFLSEKLIKLVDDINADKFR